ncbi:MAG: methyltransferase domain-containing protein [Gemmatimonas sp.]
MQPSKRQYFEEEARLAALPGHPRHINPEFPRGARVVSIGCGGGWSGEAGQAARFVGVDIDEDAREFRLERNPSDEIHIGSGDDLPFKDGEFTFYMARVSIMYMDVNRAMAEAFRVLAPGGQVWITGHDFDHVWSHWTESVRRVQLKDIVFRSYVLLNGWAFHLLGSTFRFPLKRSRLESFQTQGGLRRGLERAGFVDIQFPVAEQQILLVTAKKP